MFSFFKKPSGSSHERAGHGGAHAHGGGCCGGGHGHDHGSTDQGRSEESSVPVAEHGETPATSTATTDEGRHHVHA